METTQIVSIFLFMENACRGIPGRGEIFGSKILFVTFGTQM